MRASVLGTGHRLPARARVKVNRSAHFRRQPDRQPACMHCMHKNRLNFSDMCVIMHAGFWLAGWLAAGWLLAGGLPKVMHNTTPNQQSAGVQEFESKDLPAGLWFDWSNKASISTHHPQTHSTRPPPRPREQVCTSPSSAPCHCALPLFLPRSHPHGSRSSARLPTLWWLGTCEGAPKHRLPTTAEQSALVARTWHVESTGAQFLCRKFGAAVE